MLFKDEKKYTLSQKDRDELMEVIRKFPVSIIFVPEKFTTVKDSNGKLKKVFPPGVDVDLKYSVVDDKGNSFEFRWAESPPVTRDNRKTYYPTSYHFSRVTVFNKEDIELLWFIYTCCPVLRYGKNANPNGIHEIMINTPFLTQEKEVSYVKMLSKAQNIVMGDEKEISDHKLRNIANALFIPNVEELERIELQFAINELLKSGNQKYNKEKILARFFELIEDDDLQKVTAMVNLGFEKQVLNFYENTGSVKLKVGDKEEVIVKKVPSNQDFKELTVKAIMANDDNKSFLELAIA
jgi:hypothetical protein